MCGIAGFLGTGSEHTLAKMCDALSRRGPDDHGTFSGGGIGLSHTRLAIIDLSSQGHQPMLSGNAQLIVSFNGEIYNYKTLRKEIEATGAYTFRTESDTEVILAAYETMGVHAFAKLDGMFAFALYDTRTETMYLVRDRLGKKPLYWGLFDDSLVFGSELKALMMHESFKKEIDPESLAAYLAYEYVPTPRSMLKGVSKLPPASYLAYRKGGTPEIQTYWALPYAPSHDVYEYAVKKTDQLMRDAVTKRLVSDVPLGVFLSGGIDSSAVAYYAREKGDVRTFSVGFDDKDFDESQFAAQVARELGTQHTEERFSPEQSIACIGEVFSYLDEPIADASILPTYLLSGFTRRHVTVALGGDGGDELFAGYPTFQAEALVGSYEMIPRLLRDHMIAPLVRALPSSDSNLSFDFKLKRFIAGADAPDYERHQRWLGAFTNDAERDALLQKSAASPFAGLRPFFDGAISRNDRLNRLLWSYARTYLMDEVLVKVDRASMAHGLEVRTPLLDTALVEYVMNLPYHYKYSGFTGKRLLKSAMRGKLLDSIIDRKKKGFGIPMARWLKTDLNPLMHELLSDDELKKSDVFNPEPIRQLMAEHEAGTADHRKKLWTLMVFQLWHAQWMR